MQTPMEELPEDVQKEITDLRRQKDNFRKGLKEYQGKYEEAGELLAAANANLDAAKANEDAMGKLTVEMSTKDLELARVRAAAAAKLDLSFADRLRGDTAEELAADALVLAGQFSGSAPAAPAAFVDASQGQGNAGGPKVDALNSGNFADNLANALQSMDDSGNADA